MTIKAKILCLMPLVPLLALSACERDTAGLELSPTNSDPVVFTNGLAGGVEPQSFLGSKLDAFQIDNEDGFPTAPSAKITVPSSTNPNGTFAGGAAVAPIVRDLSRYNALSYYAKSTVDASLNSAGFGNDNTGNSRYTVEVVNTPLTQDVWTRHIIPIPNPDRLTLERGLFWYAEGFEDPSGAGYTLWFDEMLYTTVAVTDPRPTMTTPSMPIGTFVGAKVSVPGTQTTFTVEAADFASQDVTVIHDANYFDFVSSDPSVLSITDAGISVVGAGETTLTATLRGVEVVGSVAIKATEPPPMAAPAPTFPAADVLALYSRHYNSRGIANFAEFPSGPTVTDLVIDGDEVKAYTDFDFVGLQFNPVGMGPDPTPQVDASSFPFFHMQVWVPNAAIFKVKLVDFGEDGRFPPTSEGELQFNLATEPSLVSGEWVTLDLPLADFNLNSTRYLAQLILSIVGFEKTAFVDNILFHK